MGKFFSDKFESRANEIFNQIGCQSNNQLPDDDDIVNAESLGCADDIAATGIAIFASFSGTRPGSLFSEWAASHPGSDENPREVLAACWIRGVIWSARCFYERAAMDAIKPHVDDSGRVVFESVEDFEYYLDSIKYGDHSWFNS